MERLLHQLFHIVNASHRGDGIIAQMRAYDQRLGIRIADAADSHRPRHFPHVPLKLCAEWGILDIMNRPVEAGLRIIHRHTAPPGAEVGVIVHAEKQIGDTAVTRNHAE